MISQVSCCLAARTSLNVCFGRVPSVLCLLRSLTILLMFLAAIAGDDTDHSGIKFCAKCDNSTGTVLCT